MSGSLPALKTLEQPPISTYLVAVLSNLLRLIRPAQWLKNGIILAPLVFAAEATNSSSVLLALAATGFFCLLSSSIYIFNDIVDREKDRQHPLKKSRPLASEEVTVGTAAVLMLLLLAIGLIGAWRINLPTFWFAAGFVGLNLIYSLFLKNIVMVDVMAIGFSFVLRAYAGAAAINVPASKWLLINTLLLALFLGFGKRRHELMLLEESATNHRKILNKYSAYLLDQCIGITTASVVVMYMLYSFSSEVSTKLGTENLYLTIPFVVYGIFRYLYLIHKEDKGGSPTQIMLTDRPILLTILLWIATAIGILYRP